jgi:hypothetical protein
MAELKLEYKREFHKGDKVIWVDLDADGVRLYQGEITSTNKEIVNVKHAGEHGWKRRFSSNGYNYEPRIYPLWQLRHLNGGNFAEMESKINEASENYKKHRQEYREKDAELKRQASDWAYNELNKWTKAQPHNWEYLVGVAASQGFKEKKAEEK